ncbi:hypothetical protein [Aliamphritea spongicola]|nr:hypothetical protein [Aliamphritea spongicola]
MFECFSIRLITLLSIGAITGLSYFYVGFVDFREDIGGSKERLTTIADSSNYLRFAANIDFIDRVAEGDFIIVGNGSNIDDRTSHRPHNAFFRAGYRYGILLSILAVFIYFYVVKNTTGKLYQ